MGKNEVKDVDPKTGYVYTDSDKEFITLWIEFKNLVVVSAMMDMSQREVSELLASEPIRNEIDRLSSERIAKRFTQRVLTLDEMQAFLSGYITDEGVPFADRLDSKGKMNALKLLLDVKEAKAEGIENPQTIDAIPTEVELKSLSVDTIKALLDTRKESEQTNKEKQALVARIGGATPMESADLMNMSTSDLLKILDNINKAKGNNSNGK